MGSFGDRQHKVTIRFVSGGQEIRFGLPIIEDWIHPGVIYEVNKLMLPLGSRFYFLDLNPQMGIVTRATEKERAVLQSLRGVELRERSDWWEGLAKAVGR
ncbi:MAG: hypothetical protein ACLQRM_04200 [Acidimicrobiales bacterium]